MCWQEVPWYQDPNWLTAFGTIGAVVVALFGLGLYDYIIKPLIFRIRPVPKITIDPLNHADCHQTTLTINAINYDTDGNPFPVSATVETYLLRFRVKNEGKYFIEDAEVMIEELKKLDNNEWKEIKGFVPLNLQWSNYDTGKITVPKIQRDMFKHCDFVYLISPSKWNKVIPRWDQGSLSPKRDESFEVVGDLATAVKPNILHPLEPGEYRVKIKLAGNNIAPQTVIYRFKFKNTWFDKEQEMLTNNISITPE